MLWSERMALIGQTTPRREDASLFACHNVRQGFASREGFEKVRELILPGLGVAQPKLPNPDLCVLCGDLLALQLFDSPKDLEPTLVVLLQESPERPRQASPFSCVAVVF